MRTMQKRLGPGVLGCWGDHSRRARKASYRYTYKDRQAEIHMVLLVDIITVSYIKHSLYSIRLHLHVEEDKIFLYTACLFVHYISYSDLVNKHVAF